MRIWISIIFLTFTYLTPAFGYPEFQRYIKKVSGRSVDCSICHKNPEGPNGLNPGQIGSLTPNELKDLGLARQAFMPGTTVTDPILNKFGNSVLKQLGGKKILELRQNPQMLATSLSKTSDMDGDGIPDVEELKDGTNPLNSLDGLPWKLFKNNFRKNIFHIFMIFLATGFGLFGLTNALLWLAIKTRKE